MNFFIMVYVLLHNYNNCFNLRPVIIEEIIIHLEVLFIARIK